MPAYFRNTSGAQTSWAISELAEALSVEVEAALQRAAYTDTWTPGGTGLPMPLEVSVSVPITAASAPQVASTLYSLSQQDIGAVGYESPLGAQSALEWERPVLAVRALEVREGGPRYVFVRMRFLVDGRISRLYRLGAENGDELTAEDGTPLVAEEEV